MLKNSRGIKKWGEKPLRPTEKKVIDFRILGKIILKNE